jgi:ABC-type antimicrobial peptide transport system permease subunit
VATRTRELGIRRALGAAPNHVAGVVARPALVTVGSGVAIGLILSAVVTALLRSRLPHGTAATVDPLTLAVSASLMISAALVATLLPIRRAVRVNPSVALRDG